MDYKVNQKLRKHFDGTVVTIKETRKDYIILDGDFEPNHLVMRDKVEKYYSALDGER